MTVTEIQDAIKRAIINCDCSPCDDLYMLTPEGFNSVAEDAAKAIAQKTLLNPPAPPRHARKKESLA